jgi:hypothetical protein
VTSNGIVSSQKSENAADAGADGEDDYDGCSDIGFIVAQICRTHRQLMITGGHG